jgi:hypothetical protein
MSSSATSLQEPVAWRWIWPPVAVVVVVLSALSNGYGFDRDELYFAMLRPAWGYVDQPPLVPLVAHGLAALAGGGPWLVRVPATLCAAGCLVVSTDGEPTYRYIEGGLGS